jgi:uncharacterized protein
MKTIIKTSLLSALFTIIALTLIHFFFTHSWYLFSGASSDSRFTVQGTATMTEKPDEATISFMVSKIADKLEDAQAQANTVTNKIVVDLKKMGIAEKDIKTSNYSSYPVYEKTSSGKSINSVVRSGGSGVTIQPPMAVIPPPQSDQQPIVGYTVSQNVNVTVRNISKANGVVDTITKDGAENISGPSFTFSDSKQKSLTDQARVAAIADAKQKAQSLAKAAGIHLGRIVDIQEDGAYPMRMTGSKSLDSNGSVGIATQAISLPTNLNPGENTITQNVALSYETW